MLKLSFSGIHFLLLIFSLCFSVACSKKSLTELANADAESNSGGGGSGNSGGNGGGGGSGSTAPQGRLFFLNGFLGGTNQFTTEPGSIFTTDFVGNNIYFQTIHQEGQELVSFDISSNVNWLTVSHPGRLGAYLARNNGNSTYQLMYFKFSDYSLSDTGITNSITSRASISGDYLLINDEGVNKVVHGTTVQELESYLGLDPQVESANSTSNHIPLGKGQFLITTSIANAGASNQLILFDAASKEIRRISTDHQISNLISYSDNSALFLIKNTNGDQKVYFMKYSDMVMTEKLSYLQSSGEDVQIVKISAQDNDLNYYILIRQGQAHKYTLYQFDQATGATSAVAEQDWSSISDGSDMNQCDFGTNPFGSENAFEMTFFKDGSLWMMCKTITSGKYLLIQANLSNQELKSYVLVENSGTNRPLLFTYKEQFYYIEVGNQNEATPFSIASGQVVINTVNQLKLDMIDHCEMQYPELNCVTGIEHLTSSAFSVPMNPIVVDYREGGITGGGILIYSFQLTADSNTKKSVIFRFNQESIQESVQTNYEDWSVLLVSLMNFSLKLIYDLIRVDLIIGY